VPKLRWLFVGYVVIALFAGWPIISVVIAGSIASWNGCTLHEGFVNPCIVGGRDIGGTLYSMGVMGWFMLATIPIGAVAFVAWTVAWVIWRMMKKRKTADVKTI
jgi:hypothetical protein